MFDLITGTSAGSIIASLLFLKKWTIDHCKQEFTKIIKDLFPTSSRIKHFLQNAMYGEAFSVKPLHDALEHSFGSDTTLLSTAEKGPKIIIVSYDAEMKKPFLFGNFAGNNICWNVPIITALIASSAAPTYFKHVSFEGRKLVDGGVGLNNPSVQALLRARELWSRIPYVILSLGTGLSTTTEYKDSVSSQAKLIIEAATNTEKSHEDAQRWCEENKCPNYFRLNVDGIGDIQLSDSSTSSQEIIIKKTQDWCKKNVSTLKKISFCLLAQLFFISDDNSSDMHFYILSRVPKHFSIWGDIITWENIPQDTNVSLKLKATSSDDSDANIKFRIEENHEGWKITMENPQVGKYTLEACFHVRGGKEGEEEKYHVSGSSCMLVISHGPKKLMSLQSKLKVFLYSAETYDGSNFFSYCEVDNIFTTKKYPNNIKQKWNELFMLNADDNWSKESVLCFNLKNSYHKIVGTCEIALKQVECGFQYKKELKVFAPCENPDDRGKKIGILTLGYIIMQVNSTENFSM